MSQQVRLSAFYGANLARPYSIVDEKTGKVTTGRVDRPSVNGALIEWANKAPFEAGGAVVKPHSALPEIPKARNEFQIFCDTQRMDILASNPTLFNDPDQKGFKVAASLFWKEKLTDEERLAYRKRAAAERSAAADAQVALEQSNPEYKQKREREMQYKKAKGAKASAIQAANGPLWRAKRRRDAPKDNSKELASEAKPKKARRVPVPASLRVVIKKKPSKNLNGVKRSKAGAAKQAAAQARAEEETESEGDEETPQPSPATTTASEGTGTKNSDKESGYTDEFDLPDAKAPARRQRGRKQRG